MDFVIRVLRTLFNFLFIDHEILGNLILPLIFPTIIFCTPILVRFIKNLKRFDEQNRRIKTTYCSVAAVMALLHVAFLIIVVLSWTNILPWFTYFALLGEFGFVAMFIGVLLGVLASIAGIVVDVKFFIKGCPAESRVPEWMYILGMVIISIVSGLLYLLIFPIVQSFLFSIQKRLAVFRK